MLIFKLPDVRRQMSDDRGQKTGAEDRCQEVEDGWPWACGGSGEFGEGEWQAPVNGPAAALEPISKIGFWFKIPSSPKGFRLRSIERRRTGRRDRRGGA